MTTLDSLKRALRQIVPDHASSEEQRLSDEQYSDGFALLRDSKRMIYRDFITPQLSRLLTQLSDSHDSISVLEIGPGPMSVLGSLSKDLRQKIRRYAAFEPNALFAGTLENWLFSSSVMGTELPLPCMEVPPEIHRIPFGPDTRVVTTRGNDKFDVVLFCHSMYGMKPIYNFIVRALEMAVPEAGMVVVFHRDGALHLDGLVCSQTVSFPTGTIRVSDDDESLDLLASFAAGVALKDSDVHRAIRWREVCRALGHREEPSSESRLSFSAPEVMMTFNQHFNTLSKLVSRVPSAGGSTTIKNREARLHQPASIMRPTTIRHVQHCVQWALEHGIGLTIVGGGHSGHCIQPNVVSVDMGSFDEIHVLSSGDNGSDIVVAGAGCKTGQIIRKAISAGVTVPLGARPSVGAGLWLQGGIGHLARLHGLACDAIVGAVVVSVESGQVLCIGHVPLQHQPDTSVRPENEAELLWAIKGAGTNFGIVISVTFAAHPAPTFSTRNWIVPMRDSREAQLKLRGFNQIATGNLPRNCSADAYLYWDAGRLHLGVTMFEVSTTTNPASGEPSPQLELLHSLLGAEGNTKLVDSVGLFETEMYMTGMHGGHGGGKTSSFKRCLFLKSIGTHSISETLLKALETCPSPFCYLHLLQGGGAVSDVPDDATAFGCRDWDYACVITGVWPREADCTETSLAAVRWVYAVVENLLPLSSGAYGADLGPDPRDAALAAKAFGPNRPRLSRLKHSMDPHNVLAYACLLPTTPTTPTAPKLILLVTGDTCAGKDYCAGAWASEFIASSHTARVVSISDATKREYAAATGADLDCLLHDRWYKEKHRPALTRYFQEQVRHQPGLPVKTFLDVVHGAADVDVLLITGMRDKAPVTTLSHLVSGRRLLDIRVIASEETKRARRGCHDDREITRYITNNASPPDYSPDFCFHNSFPGDCSAKSFAQENLLPFLDDDLERLASMVRTVSGFPRPDIDFRHVLDIPQQPGGLALCASLLQARFAGDWDKIDAVVCCEAGGFLFAPALAVRVGKRLVPIREAGKLPPPTVSVVKCPSHISSSRPEEPKEKMIEMDRDAIPKGASVVVVDDVFATGKTFCAVLRLLEKAGVSPERVSFVAVAEFPAHRGRELLRERGFGRVGIRSLLVFGGV